MGVKKPSWGMVGIGHTTLARADVNAALHVGGLHGWRVTFASAGGVHQFCAFAINYGPGSNAALGCRTMTVPYQPIGNLESAAITGHSVTMAGWALDQDNMSAAESVQIWQPSATTPYGAYLGRASASLSRPDVDRALHVPGNHGWRVTFTVPDGPRTLCAYALNIGVPAPNRLLGCRSVSTTLAWDTSSTVVDAPDGGVRALTCRTADMCVFVGAGGDLARYDGAAWTAMPRPPAGNVLIDLDCLSPSFCVGTSGNALWSYDGTAWTARLVFAAEWHGFLNVSCGSPTFCIAQGLVVLYVFDGTAWRSGPTPQAGYINNTACYDAAHCVDSMGYAFDGVSWHSLPGYAGPILSDTSCTSATFCLAAISYSLQVFDGSWQPPFNTGSNQLSLSCVTPQFCAATDQSGSARIFDGTSWSGPTVLDPAHSTLRQTVRCASITLCWATDGERLIRYDGTTWSTPLVVQDYRSGTPVALSCAGRTSCTVIDPEGHVVRYDAGGWQTPSRIVAEGTTLTGLSCPTPAWCLITTDAGALSYDGQTATPIPSSVTVANSTSLSCVSPTFCLLVTASGVIRYDGATWTPVAGTGDGATWQLSCATATYCLLVQSSGLVRTYNGSTVGPPVPGPPSVAGLVVRLAACPAAGVCDLVRSDPSAYGGLNLAQVSGSSLAMSAGWPIGVPSGGIDSLSCPTLDFCAVLDQFGGVSFARPSA